MPIFFMLFSHIFDYKIENQILHNLIFTALIFLFYIFWFLPLLMLIEISTQEKPVMMGTLKLIINSKDNFIDYKKWIVIAFVVVGFFSFFQYVLVDIVLKLNHETDSNLIDLINSIISNLEAILFCTFLFAGIVLELPISKAFRKLFSIIWKNKWGFLIALLGSVLVPIIIAHFLALYYFKPLLIDKNSHLIDYGVKIMELTKVSAGEFFATLYLIGQTAKSIIASFFYIFLLRSYKNNGF